MFMGKQNNNANGVNVNTKLYTSYSDNCMITLGAWNTNLSLKIHPFKGVNADGVRQYAQDQSEVINTSLTVDNTTALLDGIKDHITPALNAHTDASVSVAMGAGDNRKVLTISTNGTDVTLTIAIRVNENGVAEPTNIIEHKFNKKEYMTGYNPITGEGTVQTSNSDYENFVKKLESIYDLAPAVAHSINYNNAMKSSFSNKQAAYSQANTQPAYSAPTSNYSGDMSDFLPFN